METETVVGGRGQCAAGGLKKTVPGSPIRIPVVPFACCSVQRNRSDSSRLSIPNLFAPSIPLRARSDVVNSWIIDILSTSGWPHTCLEFKVASILCRNQIHIPRSHVSASIFTIPKASFFIHTKLTILSSPKLKIWFFPRETSLQNPKRLVNNEFC